MRPGLIAQRQVHVEADRCGAQRGGHRGERGVLRGMGSAEHERASGQHGGQQRLTANTIDHASLSLDGTIGRRLQALQAASRGNETRAYAQRPLRATATTID
jgi:hypothetical protein